MATIPVSPPKVIDPQGVFHYPEGASQTFKVGDLLKLSSNLLVPAAADDGGLLIAAQKASGTSGTMIACYKLAANTEIEIGVNSTTSVTVGTSYGFTLSGTTALLVGTDTNARVIVRPLAGTADTNWIGI
jgi:hypothetical protein